MNLNKIENTVKLIKQVEKTHRGLGLVCDFLEANAHAQNGLILCGEYETGKSASALGIHEFVDFPLKILGTKTISALADEKNQAIQKSMSNNRVYWTAEDLAYASEIVVSNTLKVVSALLDKHDLHHDVKGGFINLKNVKLTFVGCATYDILQLLFKTREWIGNYSQRLFRYYVLPFLPFIPIDQNPSYSLNPSPIYEDNLSKVKLDKLDINYKLGLKLFDSQFEPKRALINYERWLKGHALFNHRYNVEPEDFQVLLLNYPNLRFEKWFAKRVKPSEPKIYDLDSAMLFSYCLRNMYQFANANTIDAIKEKFDLSERTTRELLNNNPFLEPFILDHNKHAFIINNKVVEFFGKQRDFIEVCVNS